MGRGSQRPGKYFKGSSRAKRWRKAGPEKGERPGLWKKTDRPERAIPHCRDPSLLAEGRASPTRPRTCEFLEPKRVASTSWPRLASVTLIPCRTWMCFSRIRRLLKVRLPSVQYLGGQTR